MTPLSFLDFRLHWRATIDFIGESARRNGHDAPGRIRADSFRVVCVEEATSVVGGAGGDGNLELHLLNESQLHYVPLLRRTMSWHGRGMHDHRMDHLGPLPRHLQGILGM